MTEIVVLDSENRIMLPVSIRERYNIRPGDTLSIHHQGNGKITLEPLPTKGIEDVRAAFDAFVNRDESEPMPANDAVRKNLEDTFAGRSTRSS